FASPGGLFMNCREARRALLDAEPDELRGLHESPLALHVQRCDACRAHATTILTQMDVLRSALDSFVTAHTGEMQSARAAQATLRAHGAHGKVGRDDSAADIHDLRLRTRRIGRRVLASLAVAAALAALLLADGWSLRSPFDDAPLVELYVAQPGVPDAPIVNAVGASGVAVMRTSNPMITVVWTF
ncbi:MAG: hypothetical protein ACREKM_10135, partial [Longimicrobiales bacterium]